VTWLLLPVLGQLSHRTPLFVHYFLIVLPAPFMLIGYLIGRLPVAVTASPAGTKQSPQSTRGLLRRVSRLPLRLAQSPPGMLFAMTLIGLIAFAQAYQVLTLQQFVATRPTPGGMSVPIGYYEQLVDQAKDALRKFGGAEIVVNTHGSNPSVDESPAIFDFLLNEVPHRFVDVGQATALYPALSHIQIDYAPDGTLSTIDGQRELLAQLTLRATESPAAIYRVEGAANPPCEVMARHQNGAATSARWSNGVSLLTAQIDSMKPGEKAAIHVCFKIDHLVRTRPEAEEFHWTAQLWDKAGRRWAQVDDNGYPTRYWRAGDVISQTLTLDVPADVPAGDYVLRVGQYTWPEVKPVLTMDVMGNPQSDAVEIPVRVEP